MEIRIADDLGGKAFAIFNGEIIFSYHQKDLKGYGGFIILKHKESDTQFYTLYGHLSEHSISKFSKGDIILKNQQIGILGDYVENGNWVPHLHFQIIKDLENNIGDYPGVSSKKNIEFYKDNCPNPNFLLKIPPNF